MPKTTNHHALKPVEPTPDFPAREKEVLEWWYSSGIVNRYLHKNDHSPEKFSFIDGPITANNPMAVHHAWGRTYKDLWQRVGTMQGKKERFQNGFDCQGLWVEVEVEKELGFKSKKDIEVYGVANFVNKCKERVLKYAAIQTQQSKRLGYFMDWDNSYFTMSDENNYEIWNFLKICHQRGWIYKGHDSVPWCPRCETAISQHEMLTEDYKEVIHQAIYFSLPLKERTGEYLLVWTTTPWTLPANIAVAVDEDLDYVLAASSDGKKYWLISGKESLIPHFEVLKKIKGRELVGLKYAGPFDHLSKVKKTAAANPEKFHLVIATDPQIMPITVTEGTGIVHTAVSAGTEDFQLGKKLGLPMIPVIADNADYLPDLDELSGKNAKKHPEVVFESMPQDFIFKIENYTHRYPACWRCHTELVWKVADEWYIAMDTPDPTDKGGRSLREEMMSVARKITWLPAFGLDRELDWLKNMHDWLISKKNRYWGLALPIYECRKCGHFEVLNSKEDLENRAVEGWDKFLGNSPHRPWIDEVKIKCPKCGEKVSRILDVGNPWLDAGIIPFSTLHYKDDPDYWKQWFPAEFITESFPGQFKNWFYSLLVMGTVLEKTNPFKTVLGYGSLLAEDGRPMHKSWGNSIEFNEGADKIGVDVMRWLFARSSPSDNLLFGYKKADEVRRQFILILWNTYNFFVTYALLDNWTPKSKKTKNITVLDDWMLARLQQTVLDVTTGLDKFDAQSPALSIESFVSDISTWYIRRSRDRVGPSVNNQGDKEAFYQTAFEILITLSKLLAPFMPFVSEEIYRNLTGEESVHLASWPQTLSKAKADDNKLLNDMARVRKICELGNAQRKELGIKIRQPLSRISIFNISVSEPGLQELIKQELNIKALKFIKDKGEQRVEFTTTLTPELLAEGQAREIVRQIQDARKQAQTTLDQKVVVTLPDWPAEFEDYIKTQTLATKLVKGDALTISS